MTVVGGVDPQSDLGGCGGRVDRPQGSAAAVEDAHTRTHTSPPFLTPCVLCHLLPIISSLPVFLSYILS